MLHHLSFLLLQIVIKTRLSFFKSIPSKADVAENLCYIAEQKGVRYRSLFPTCFEKEPQEGVWPLSSYGHYGIGTVFSDSVYHLFQSRLQSNIELFIKRCEDVLKNEFNTSNFIPSTTFDHIKNIVPLPQPRKKSFLSKIFEIKVS